MEREGLLGKLALSNLSYASLREKHAIL